jgi:hypothetical protein
MTRPTPSDLEVARRILEHEPPSGPGASERAAAAVRVYEHLFERLSPVIGVAGMRAVLARSARLTTPEFPCFDAVCVASELAAERLHACLLQLEEGQMADAAAALYGTLVGLLNSFIGKRLVWQVLRSAFPGIEESTPEEKES